MDFASQMTLLGGVAKRRTVVNLRGSAEVDAALRDGTIVPIARGRVALPEAHPGIKTAFSVAGVLSHRSAAAYWGWGQKRDDKLPEVTVARNRHVDPHLRTILIPHWSDLPEEDIVKGVVTTKRRTLVDCMRNLPLDEALAIADSALRAGDVTKEELQAIAASTRGRGRTRIMGVAEEATAKAANALESVARAQCLLIPGLSVTAQRQVTIGGRVLHPDVVSEELKIVVETEGLESHRTPKQLTQDCRRYNLLVRDGWIIIRFSWYLVMFEAAYVQQVLREVVEAARHHRHANVALAA